MNTSSPVRVRDAQKLASARTLDALPPPTHAEIAFAGRSNVGKSSLVNALVGRRALVRTSRTPGCTRGIDLVQVELANGATLGLVDLPGYGFARRAKHERRAWGELVEGYLRARAGLRVVVIVVDVRRGLEAEEHDLLEMLDDLGHEALLVATKLDHLTASRRKPTLAALRRETGQPIFAFSATTGEGRDALWAALLERAAIGS